MSLLVLEIPQYTYAARFGYEKASVVSELQEQLQTPSKSVEIVQLKHRLHSDLKPFHITLKLEAEETDEVWSVSAIEIREYENTLSLPEGKMICLNDVVKTIVWDWKDKWIVLVWKDLNFDGYDDLLVALSQDMANTWYRALFYRPDSKMFDSLTGLDAENGIPDPEVIPKKRQLVTSSRSSAGGHLSSFYQFDQTQGQYELFQEEETEYDEQTDKVMLSIRERVNGQMRIIETHEVKPE